MPSDKFILLLSKADRSLKLPAQGNRGDWHHRTNRTFFAVSSLADVTALHSDVSLNPPNPQKLIKTDPFERKLLEDENAFEIVLATSSKHCPMTADAITAWLMAKKEYYAAFQLQLCVVFSPDYQGAFEGCSAGGDGAGGGSRPAPQSLRRRRTERTADGAIVYQMKSPRGRSPRRTYPSSKEPGYCWLCLSLLFRLAIRLSRTDYVCG